MLPRADTLGIRPASNVEATSPVSASGDARQEVFHRLSQIALGSQLSAEVIRQLDDGTFIIKIADTQAKVVLPNGTRVGDSLLMTLLASQPRPAFLLNAEGGSASAQLSSAGRLITSLLQTAQQQNAATWTTGKASLITSADVLLASDGVPRLAAALQQALSSSGLFYESHLQDWITGSRTLNQMANEPQMQFARQLPTAANTNFSAAELAQLLGHLRQWVGSERALVDLLKNAQRPSSPTTDADTILGMLGPNADSSTLSPDSVKMIHQQLHSMENRQIAWHGELWPGHPIKWEISEEQSQQPHSDEEPTAWNSTMRFELPLLGEISASIRLQGERVQVDVRTSSEDSAELLRTHRTELASALDIAGSPLDLLLVKRDEKT